MKKTIITISREFGSGGRSIGRMVAEKLGYRFYDQELILEVARESGLSREIVEQYEEYASHKSSFLYALALSNSGSNSFASQVQIAQTRVIRALADEGNCVIVGRGADKILEDREDCLHVFIHADPAYRAKRIVELYGETSKKPMDRLNDKDQRRKVFYKSITMRDWGMSQNYHLSLNSGVIGPETCAEIIAEIVRKSE